MREIKFRGRSLYEEKQWVYGLVFKSGSEGQWMEIQGDNGATCYVDPETIGQYTGLKDKNGKEIYEGDIVCDQYANFYTPIFRNGIYMAYNVEYLNLTKQEPSTQFNVVWNNGCEVIGNIYDSPELLGRLGIRTVKRKARIRMAE